MLAIDYLRLGGTKPQVRHPGLVISSIPIFPSWGVDPGLSRHGERRVTDAEVQGDTLHQGNGRGVRLYNLERQRHLNLEFVQEDSSSSSCGLMGTWRPRPALWCAWRKCYSPRRSACSTLA